MQSQEIIERILSEKPNLKLDDIKKIIQRKMAEASGFLTEEGAAYVVASEMGINLPEKARAQIRIKDLVSGLNNVTVAGYVLSTYPIQSFKYSNGETGKRSGFIMADKTGVINVVLWNEKAELIDKIFANKVVKVMHGYVREGRDKKITIGVGFKGDVMQSPLDEDPSNYPETKDFFKKIDALQERDNYVNVIGTVTHVFPIIVFERKVQEKGQVLRVNLTDETGTIKSVFWNDQVDLLIKLKTDDCLQIIGAHVKRGMNEKNELHVDEKSCVSILKEKTKVKATPLKFIKIKDLREKMYDLNIIARVICVGSIQNLQESGNDTISLANLLIKDETGEVRLALWKEKAEISKSISINDVILAEGVYTKKGIRSLNLHTGKFSKMTINPNLQEAEKIPLVKIEKIKINQLRTGLKEFSVEGTVVTAPTVEEIKIKRGEIVRVASFRLKDATGEVKVSVWRELVNLVENLTEGENTCIMNPTVKEGLTGLPELSTNALTSIKNTKEDEDISEVIIFEKDNSKE